MAIGGAGMSAIGQVQQGKAAQAAADYESAVQLNNAKIAEMQATDAIERGNIEKDKIKLEAKQIAGTGRTQYAAGNVLLDSGGTPLSWEQDVAAGSATDVEMADYNAKMEAWGFKNQANSYRADSAMARQRGKQAVKSSYWGAASSLIGAAGTTGLQYYKATA